MTTPEKQTKMHVQALEVKGLKHKVATMQDKLEKFLHDSGEQSALPDDSTLNDDVSALVSELHGTVQLEPHDSFKRIFWEQQVRTCTKPCMVTHGLIENCIYIIHTYTYTMLLLNLAESRTALIDCNCRKKWPKSKDLKECAGIHSF